MKRWRSGSRTSPCVFWALGALCLVLNAAHAQSAAPEAPRPGFLLIFGSVTHRDAMVQYGRSLPPIYAQFGGRAIADGRVGAKVRVLEGRFPHEAVVLSKFSSLEGPNAFWWSPEYRRSAEMRRGAGTFTVLKLAGMPGDLQMPEGKPAYLVSIADLRDREKLKPYAAAAGPQVKAAGGKLIAAGGRKDIELLEGEFGNLTVNVLQFPSIDALRRFYEDPAYRPLIAIRQAAGDYVLLEVEGR
jgi:uncharacterized protein (DUF1330 family)